MSRQLFRPLADSFLLALVLFAPWWFTALFGLVCFFLFDGFVELLLAALFADFLYGAPTSRLFGFPFVLSFSAALLFLALGLLKKRLRFTCSLS